jgi:hypothetical protein
MNKITFPLKYWTKIQKNCLRRGKLLFGNHEFARSRGIIPTDLWATIHLF